MYLKTSVHLNHLRSKKWEGGPLSFHCITSVTFRMSLLCVDSNNPSHKGFGLTKQKNITINCIKRSYTKPFMTRGTKCEARITGDDWFEKNSVLSSRTIQRSMYLP